MNGKEYLKNSFENFTASTLINKMKQTKDKELQSYALTASDRKYNAWLRDPLAALVTSREMAAQKLEYMPARQVIQAGT